MRRLLNVIAITACTAGIANANPVGMVCYLSGSAQVHKASGWGNATMLERLEPGDTLRCSGGAQAVVVIFASGARYRVTGTGTVGAGGVSGGQALAGLSGPSAQVAQQLGGARTGAFGMRGGTEAPKRLYKTDPGYWIEGDKSFHWDPVENAASYSFTIFDCLDNIVWSIRTTDTAVQYPDNLPPLLTTMPNTRIRPYVWRLCSFGASGKPIGGGASWGVFSVLSKADADALQSNANAFQTQLAATPADPTTLPLEMELYREYGDYQTMIELWDQPQLRDNPGRLAAMTDIYREISRYAQALANHIPVVEQAP